MKAGIKDFILLLNAQHWARNILMLSDFLEKVIISNSKLGCKEYTF